MALGLKEMTWLVVSIPLKNMKVSWDDYSQYMGKNIPNHQPVTLFFVEPPYHWVDWILGNSTSLSQSWSVSVHLP